MAAAISPRALAALLGHGWRRPGEASHALSDALRALVVDGRLAVRTRVPSERALADELGISRGSVSRAYDRLREEGYLASRRGAGCWLTRRATRARSRWCGRCGLALSACRWRRTGGTSMRGSPGCGLPRRGWR